MIWEFGGDHAAITVDAVNEREALAKAYLYHGAYTLTYEEMRVILNNSNFDRACEIFNNLSDTKLVWLSEIQNNPLVNKVEFVD